MPMTPVGATANGGIGNRNGKAETEIGNGNRWKGSSRPHAHALFFSPRWLALLEASCVEGEEDI